jgi:fructose/tagatose bisphosphate aldolase
LACLPPINKNFGSATDYRYIVLNLFPVEKISNLTYIETHEIEKKKMDICDPKSRLSFISATIVFSIAKSMFNAHGQNSYPEERNRIQSAKLSKN